MPDRNPKDCAVELHTAASSSSRSADVVAMQRLGNRRPNPDPADIPIENGEVIRLRTELQSAVDSMMQREKWWCTEVAAAAGRVQADKIVAHANSTLAASRAAALENMVHAAGN